MSNDNRITNGDNLNAYKSASVSIGQPGKYKESLSKIQVQAKKLGDNVATVALSTLTIVSAAMVSRQTLTGFVLGSVLGKLGHTKYLDKIDQTIAKHTAKISNVFITKMDKVAGLPQERLPIQSSTSWVSALPKTPSTDRLQKARENATAPSIIELEMEVKNFINKSIDGLKEIHNDQDDFLRDVQSMAYYEGLSLQIESYSNLTSTKGDKKLLDMKHEYDSKLQDLKDLTVNSPNATAEIQALRNQLLAVKEKINVKSIEVYREKVKSYDPESLKLSRNQLLENLDAKINERFQFGLGLAQIGIKNLNAEDSKVASEVAELSKNLESTLGMIPSWVRPNAVSKLEEFRQILNPQKESSSGDEKVKQYLQENTVGPVLHEIENLCKIRDVLIIQANLIDSTAGQESADIQKQFEYYRAIKEIIG